MRKIQQQLRVALVAIAMIHPLVCSAAVCDVAKVAGPRALSGRILFDRGAELWVMDGDGLHQRRIVTESTWASLNPDGIHLAYWSNESIRVLSLLDGCEVTVDSGLKRPLSDIGWSGDGKTLGYVGSSPRGRGLHVLRFPANGAAPRVFPYFSTVSLSYDGRSALASNEGIARVDLQSGKRTLIEKTPTTWGAAYARSKDVVAVLDSVVDPTEKQDDDSPNCRGANTSLRILAKPNTVQVPFPPGFNSTLNNEFDFSPDGREVAIAFGADRCDYPGDVAAVYLFSLHDRSLVRVSPSNRLAGRVKFSPDGSALIYTDFQGTGTTAIYRFELGSKKLRQLTMPRDFDDDYVMDWR